MLYKIQYNLRESQNSEPETHNRYYRALTPETALEMFKGTCEETLNGYDTEPVIIFKKESRWSPMHNGNHTSWQPVKTFQ